jgi:hypothetical protein
MGKRGAGGRGGMRTSGVVSARADSTTRFCFVDCTASLTPLDAARPAPRKRRPGPPVCEWTWE